MFVSFHFLDWLHFLKVRRGGNQEEEVADLQNGYRSVTREQQPVRDEGVGDEGVGEQRLTRPARERGFAGAAFVTS